MTGPLLPSQFDLAAREVTLGRLTEASLRATFAPRNPTRHMIDRNTIPSALLPVATTLPTITNAGPNAATGITNPRVINVYGGSTSVLNPNPPWRQWGYGAKQLSDASLRFAGNPGGPYLFPGLPSDPLGYNNGPVWRGFDTDAPVLEYLYLSQGGASSVRFIVDGQALSASSAALTQGGGNLYRYRLNFTTRKMRRIVVEESFVYFGGLVISQVDSISPLPAPATRAVWFGDSITQGSGTTFLPWCYAAQASDLLGWDEPDVIGQGGTGYVTANAANQNGNFAAHALDDIIDPDVIVIAGGRNDVGTGAGAVQAAATALFTDLHDAFPGVPVIALAPWYTTSTADLAALPAVNAQIAAAAAATGVAYIDSLGEQWVTGTGRVGATTGTGNADIVISADQTHPSQAGHDYYARRVAQAISEILAP